jgi:hypothetical protein
VRNTSSFCRCRIRRNIKKKLTDEKISFTIGSVFASALSDAIAKSFPIIGEAEFRLGYNFFYNGRDHLTPFIGGGVFKDWTKIRIHHKRRELPYLGYGTIGLLYDHEFNSIFTLGTNIKGILGGETSSKYVRWGSPVIGFDISVPITFRFGHKRHWDIRIEPFDIYLHGSESSRNYVGGRSTIGYRF